MQGNNAKIDQMGLLDKLFHGNRPKDFMNITNMECILHGHDWDYVGNGVWRCAKCGEIKGANK